MAVRKPLKIIGGNIMPGTPEAPEYQELHRDECHEHSDGQQRADQDRTAQMQHHDENDDDRDEDLLR